MSRYVLNRTMWEATSNPELGQELADHPEQALAHRDLTGDERLALERVDVRQIFLLGGHPFLLWNFALRMNGGFSVEFGRSYVAQLEGLSAADLET